MSEDYSKTQHCVIIGASHAGVNLAFSLRKEGWVGKISLYDSDPHLPYHRPPLSKGFLTTEDGIEKNLLKPLEAYEKEDIELNVGQKVIGIDREAQTISLADGQQQHYDKLVLATGASPILPKVEGIQNATNLFPLRTASDVSNIKKAFHSSASKKVVIIGAGYIGLETAASLQKMGGKITVLERAERVLARVASPEISSFIESYHTEKGVEILCNKEVISISSNRSNKIHCADHSIYEADLIIVGVGVAVNTTLAKKAGLEIENGIKVNAQTQTTDANIYAIGDCSFHYNSFYDSSLRLESVQNAIDQAKVTAQHICGKQASYNSIPWFWSDQFDLKLQTVGLLQNVTKSVLRKEQGDTLKYAVWHFSHDKLVAVEAINHPKAYVLGTKFMKENNLLDLSKLADTSVPLKPKDLLQKSLV